MDFGRVRHLLGRMLDDFDRHRLVVHIGCIRRRTHDQPHSVAADADDRVRRQRRRILAVPLRIEPADALVQRRMRGEHAAEALGEIHVAGLGRPRADELRAEHGRADSLQRAGDPLRIARELHGRGVGQILALPRHGRLDEVAEEQADEAERP